MKTNKSKNPPSLNEKHKTISGKLIRCIVPLIIFSIAIIIFILIYNARTIILDSAENSLKQETLANSNAFGSDISKFIGKSYAFTIALENRTFKDDDDLFAFLENSKSFSSDATNGIYLGLDNGDFLDLSGWKPGPDYVLADRPWYQDGLKNKTFALGIPYLDSVTNSLVVPIARKIELKDGRKGVAASDMSLASITEKTLKLKPMETGSTLLLNDDMIISYSNKKYNGTKVTEHSDDLLLTHIYETYKKNPSEVQKLQGKGRTYYVYYAKVPETNWTLIS